jgi:hypothetical protein
MGTGKGAKKRVYATQTVDTPATEERVWQQIDLPAGVEAYHQRLNNIVDKLLWRHPELKNTADNCSWLIDGEPQSGFLGYSALSSAGLAKYTVALYLEAIESLSDESLLFVAAHELTHIRLGHIPDEFQAEPSPLKRAENVTARMQFRATEPLVNDHVVALGVVSPQELPAQACVTGAIAVGFDLCGLTRREVWEMLDGRITRKELQILARKRPILNATDAEWNAETLQPSPAAQEFWRDRYGPWQENWAEAHDKLVASSRLV